MNPSPFLESLIDRDAGNNDEGVVDKVDEDGGDDDVATVRVEEDEVVKKADEKGSLTKGSTVTEAELAEVTEVTEVTDGGAKAELGTPGLEGPEMPSRYR